MSDGRTITYSAAGRLSIWDTLDHGREALLSQIEQILKNHGCASIGSPDQELVESVDESILTLTAVMAKLVSRGLPTWVDHILESALLGNCPGIQTEELSVSSNDRIVGHKFIKSDIEGRELLSAATEILLLSFNVESVILNENLSSTDHTVSEEEDAFYTAFIERYGQVTSSLLKRQIKLEDLTGKEQDDLIGQRVDFALILPHSSWVIEIDGSQHAEQDQIEIDNRRDNALGAAGWQVLRIEAETVRENIGEWFADEWEAKLGQDDQDFLLRDLPTQELFSSPKYQTAWNAIIRPHLIHRSLLGLILALRFEQIPYSEQLRLLVLEDDEPILVDALIVFQRMWVHLFRLNSKYPTPPRFEIQVMREGQPVQKLGEGITLKVVQEVESQYDFILSGSKALTSVRGKSQLELMRQVKGPWIEIRDAYSRRDNRQLLHAWPTSYDLAGLDESLRNDEEPAPTEIQSRQLDSLRYFLRALFRKKDFWDGQARVVSRLLSGLPSIVLLPTGGGKSLTYQLSALLLPGMALVIDPLLALMKDQIDNLHRASIDLIGHVSSLLEADEKEEQSNEMQNYRRYFMFIAPERMQMDDFRNIVRAAAKRVVISLAVIDEVHCVSEWGHDFRPSYLHLCRNLRTYCSWDSHTPTLVGLTGTASFAVLTDVQVEMEVREEESIVLPKSFDRKPKF